MRVHAANLNTAFEMEVDTKWLTIDADASPSELRVNNAATASLRALGAEELGLVMIHGRAKTGKSFLMNKLMGQPGFFSVGHTNTPTTVGADLSAFKPFSAFAGRSSAKGGKISFVDVEGQGDQGIDYDVMLTAPLLLVSKAVIFNWRGKMAKDEMLDKLSVLVRVASMIKPEEEDDDEGDYRIFGHLHVILRDQPNIEGVQAALFDDEKCSATNAAAMERNRKRAIIRQSFASCKVWGFPSPVKSTDDLNAGRFTEADTDAAFDEAVDEFKAVLVEQLRQPLVLCGRTLSAADVAEFVPLLAAAMNAGQKEIVPQSLFRQVEQRRAEAAAAAAIEAFDEWDKLIRKAMPMAPAVLSDAVDAQLEKGTEVVEERLAGVSEDKIEHALGLLTAHVDKSKGALELANEKHIGLKVDAAKAAAVKELDRLAAAGEKRETPEAEETLESEFKTRKANVLLEFTNATDDFKTAEAVVTGLRELKDKIAATWEAIRRHNKQVQERLQAQKEAAAEKARLEKEKAAAEEKAKKAEAARKAAETRAASAAGGCSGDSCGMGGGYGGGGGGYSDYYGGGGSSSSSYTSRGSSSGGSSSGPLYRMAAGTTNSNLSMALGNGYTIDRNGRFHDSRGRFAKNPFK